MLIYEKVDFLMSTVYGNCHYVGETPPIYTTDTIRKHEALVMKCELSNGRCMTHYVKLERSVKSKKYSVMGPTGIEWKYRDVTCLVCPSQNRRGSVIIDSCDNDMPEAKGKKTRFEK